MSEDKDAYRRVFIPDEVIPPPHALKDEHVTREELHRVLRAFQDAFEKVDEILGDHDKQFSLLQLRLDRLKDI